MIKVYNLNKYYHKGKSNQIHVIDGTSIELPSKGLITFLGHSGSGKTTLLNVIGGLDKANSGEIVYDDVTFKKYNMHKIDKFRSSHIGYVFQNYNLLLEETVYDNLRIALDLIGVTDLEEQKKRIEYSLKAVGMYKYRKKIASFLSGGQQQRVSIARALVKKSLVIIADEPTGNLDSKNTVEVMNILKKISEQSLVLLVTHEDNVANFYSDKIYEIKDGRIIDTKEVNSDVTFDNAQDDSIIYLKDLNENEYETELGNINIHSDSDEPLKINLNLIVKNGNIYLKSDKPIKLLEQSNVKIINDHYKEMKREDISSFDYDTSWYNDNSDSTNKLKKFGKRLKNSFISFRAVGRKQKFLYICLGLIGSILAIAFSVLSNAVTSDLDSSSYSEIIKTSVITNDNARITNAQLLKEGYENGEINDIYRFSLQGLTYEEQVVANHGVLVTKHVKVAPVLGYNLELVIGSEPKEKNEIVISSDYANDIKEKTARTYEELLGKYVSFYNGNKLKIVGISTKDNMMCYVSKEHFELINSSNGGYFYTSWYKGNTIKYKIGDVEVDTFYNLRNKEYEDYEIDSGRDIDLNTDDYEILVSPYLYYKVGSKISFGSINATIVGIYKNYTFDNPNIIIINKKVKCENQYYAKSSINAFVFDGSKNIKIVEGRYPTSKNEVIAPAYFENGNEIGSTIETYYGTSTIVGTFTGVYDFSYDYLTNNNNYFLYDNYWSQEGCAFNVLKDEFKTRLSQNGAKILTVKQAVDFSNKKMNTELINGFLVIFSITITGAAIFVYFVMRSKMLSDIYNIGVYRSLGASRARINLKYLSDIFILTTFTGLIGYIIGTIGYYAISAMINSVVSAVVPTKVLVTNIGMTFLGVLALYLVMNIFGMLPILMLERKTPSEIIAKYDI